MRPDRPHQVEALRRYGDSVRRGCRRTLIQMPTGAGKTHLGLRAVEQAVSRGLRGLWVAHREELVRQPLERALADGWPVDRACVWQDGRCSGLRDAPLAFASIQTLIALPDEELSRIVDGVGIVVLDEARHYAAKTWFAKVASRARSRAYLLGLDAAPVRRDGSPMGDLFDELHVGATVAELVQAGYLVPHAIIAPGEYQEELASDPVEAYLKHAPSAQGIVFCANVPFAHDVAARLTAAGMPAECINAKTDPDVRAGALKRFKRGETRVLTNVRVLTEGTDLPMAEVIMHAAQCSDLADWIQKGGRGLRPSPETGKTICKVVDLHGSFHMHGFLDDPHVYTLDGAGIQLAEGLPQLGQCPQCYAWVRSLARCAQCGRVAPAFNPPPPRVKAADLVEVRRAESDAKKRERLARWALQALRNGTTGKGLWKIAHVYRGTFGEDAPRAWIEGAIAAGQKAIDDEAASRVTAAAPLWSLMGGGAK